MECTEKGPAITIQNVEPTYRMLPRLQRVSLTAFVKEEGARQGRAILREGRSRCALRLKCSVTSSKALPRQARWRAL